MRSILPKLRFAWPACTLLCAAAGAWAQESAGPASTVDYILLPLSAPQSESLPPAALLGLDQLLGTTTRAQQPGLGVSNKANEQLQVSAFSWRPQVDSQLVAAQVIGLASNADVAGLGLCAPDGAAPLRSQIACSALSFAGNEPIVLKLSGFGVQMQSRVAENTDVSMSGAIIRQQPVTFSQNFLAVPIAASGSPPPLSDGHSLHQLSANLGGQYWLNPLTSVGLSWAYREQSGNLFFNGFRERSLNLGFTREDLSGALVGRVVSIDTPTQRIGASVIDMGLILRLPWRAALSVGAKNILKSAPAAKKAPTGIAAEDDLLDRMAYIRYEQDL